MAGHRQDKLNNAVCLELAAIIREVKQTYPPTSVPREYFTAFWATMTVYRKDSFRQPDLSEANLRNALTYVSPRN